MSKDRANKYEKRQAAGRFGEPKHERRQGTDLKQTDKCSAEGPADGDSKRTDR